jgi:hypothetical protein
MQKRKIHLGIGKPGQKVESIQSVRMDLWTRDEVKELFSELIDQAYDQFESEGTDYELDDEFEEGF